jgi:hypothetical protein
MLINDFAEVNEAKFQRVEKQCEIISGILGNVKSFLDEES